MEIICPHCGSEDIHVDTGHGFDWYWCSSCRNSWSYPEDDPADHNEADEPTEVLSDDDKAV